MTEKETLLIYALEEIIFARGGVQGAMTQSALEKSYERMIKAEKNALDLIAKIKENYNALAS